MFRDQEILVHSEHIASGMELELKMFLFVFGGGGGKSYCVNTKVELRGCAPTHSWGPSIANSAETSVRGCMWQLA